MNVHSLVEPDRSVVGADTFRQAMRLLPGGVSVVTVGVGDDRTGMTVTSISSLSLDPPSLLVCIGRQSSAWSRIHSYGVFGVSILDAAQQSIADRFAGGGGARGPERFSGASWTTLETGAPVLVDALAAIDCEVDEMIDRYSHSIVIGRVRAVRAGGGENALLYWRGNYAGLGK